MEKGRKKAKQAEDCLDLSTGMRYCTVHGTQKYCVVYVVVLVLVYIVYIVPPLFSPLRVRTSISILQNRSTGKYSKTFVVCYYILPYIPVY